MAASFFSTAETGGCAAIDCSPTPKTPLATPIDRPTTTSNATSPPINFFIFCTLSTSDVPVPTRQFLKPIALLAPRERAATPMGSLPLREEPTILSFVKQRNVRRFSNATQDDAMYFHCNAPSLPIRPMFRVAKHLSRRCGQSGHKARGREITTRRTAFPGGRRRPGKSRPTHRGGAISSCPSPRQNSLRHLDFHRKVGTRKTGTGARRTT